MKKVSLDTIYASKNIQCKICSQGCMIEPFKKNSLTSDKYKYLKTQIK